MIGPRRKAPLSLLQQLYPVVVEIAVPPRGLGQVKLNAIHAALAGVDYASWDSDGDWIAFRFRSEVEARLFQENVARAQLAA
jgi:hypothetical protein